MKTHKWIQPVLTQVPAGPAESMARAARTRLRQTVRRALILALALGGLAAAVTSGHGAQASAHSPATSNHLEASVLPTTGHAISNPWML